MLNSAENNNSPAEELARMLEMAPPGTFKSLKLDHAALVARLEALMPFIMTFAGETADLMEKRRCEDALQALDAHARKFAQALDISVEDSHSFCMCLVMINLVARAMSPFFTSLIQKKEWEEWFQKLWEKESQ